MLSKELFIKTVNDLRDLKNIYNNINDAGRKLEFFQIHNCEYEDVIFSVLQEVFKDEKNNWIGYYFYELDFGKSWCEGKVTDKEGNDIPLETAEDLYNILIDNMS